MKIVLVTHGKFASGILDTIDMLYGEVKDLYKVEFCVGESTEILAEKIREYMNDIDDNNQLLLICDIVGGTPFNVCSVLARGNKNIRVIYGLNVPLLLEFCISKDTKKIDELIDEVMSMKDEMIGINPIL